jgi:hypothetical protein
MRFDDAFARHSRLSTDKLEPIRDLFAEWNDNLRDAFVCGPMMTVDEQLVLFRGRCQFRQYIKSKTGRYGIKIWAIVDHDTNYVRKTEIYSGKSPEKRREEKQGK